MRRAGRHSESGIALIIAVMVLLVISGLGVAAIGSAGAELSAAGSARMAGFALHAADGGLGAARAQLTQTPSNLDPVDLSIGALDVESRTKAQSGAQALLQVGLGAPPEGYELNEGSGASASTRLFVIPMTASGGNARVELEVKLGRVEVGGNAY